MEKLDIYYKKISDIANELLRKSEEIEIVLVSDVSGDLISSAGRGNTEHWNKDELRILAATFSAMIGAVETTRRNRELGRAKTIYIRYQKGGVFISRIGEKGVLILFISADSNLGAIRILARKYCKKLVEQISPITERKVKF